MLCGTLANAELGLTSGESTYCEVIRAKDRALRMIGGRCIGASVEINETVARYDEPTGVEVVTSALVVGVALVERPVFPQSRAWLDGEVPNDPWAKQLQSFFNARNRRKPEPMKIPPILKMPGHEARRRGAN
jgi:hypothetical protein